MKRVFIFCAVLALWLSSNVSIVSARDVGWMQKGVRAWYFGGVGSTTSSDAEEAYLLGAVSGTNVQVTKHSGMNHWGTTHTPNTSTYSFLGKGPFWIHPQVLQTIAVGDTWMGFEITVVRRSTYTYDTFPYRLLPAKALFDLQPARELVTLNYMIAGFSTGTAYFDTETGLCLMYSQLNGYVTVFFILSEINYDFATRTAFSEDNGPHTGFKSFVNENQLMPFPDTRGGTVIIQSSVESRYGKTVEMWVSMSDSGPITTYMPPFQNYCFFGSVPVLRRINMTDAPNHPPEEWNAFGQYLWWWVPAEALARSTINVFGVPMARTSTTPYTFTATTQPTGLYFSKLWFDSDGYVTAVSAKDSTTGLDIDPGRTATYYKNLTTVEGLPYYRNTMGRATVAPVISSVTATPASPQGLGTPITVTAAVTGGIAPQQCKWFVTTDPSWATYTVLHDWQACTIGVPWTPSAAGTYQLGVWARSSGNTTDAPESSGGTSFTITAPAPPTIGAITLTPASPQGIGTAISLSATVTGGTVPQQCKWLVTTDPTWATYTVLRTWGACTSPASWTPTVAGVYQLGLWARSNGNTTDAPEGGAAAAFAYTITAPVPPTITGLGANLPSPQVLGTTISLSATVTGGTVPQQCKWLVTTDPTWATYTVLRTWGACTSPASWTPSVAGVYQLGLWARSNGNTTDAPEGGAARVLAYTVTAPAPPSISAITPTPASPQGIGTAISLSATVTGGTAPQQCKWLVTTDPTWATYTVLRTWGACTSPASWTPSVAGVYQLGLWARSNGNTTDAPEGGAARVLAYTVIPMTVAVAATPPAPQGSGTPVSLTVTVTGGGATPQCKWLLATDPSWASYSTLRTWTACSTAYAWTTPATPGPYQLGVWARSSTSTADAPDAAAVLAYTVTAPAPPSISAITPTPASPQGIGTAISLSATVTGGTAPQQCKWLVTTDPSWATYTVLHTWTACTTPASWTPTVAGVYQLGLWARSNGNTTDAPEGGAAAAFAYTVMAHVPMTVTITPSPASPQRVNTALSFGATVTGGTAPQQCKWLVSTNGWATYTTLRDWQVCTTPASWTPTAPWSYQVGVWVRSSGSSTDYPETAAAMIYDVVPDVRGTYNGNGSATQSGCTDPIDNGVFPFRGSFNIPTQTRQTFSGTGTFDTGEDVVTATLSGTVTGTGQLSGALTIAGGMGGTVGLTGTQSGTTLRVAFSGQVREGSNTCTVSGSFTGTR